MQRSASKYNQKRLEVYIYSSFQDYIDKKLLQPLK